MDRRRIVIVLGALGGLITSAPLWAQPQTKVRRIGFLAARPRPTVSNPNVYFDAFVSGMRDLGYVEGKNLVIEWRFADNKYERLPALASELAKANVEVIVAGGGTPAALAAQGATSTIPIVFMSLGDPVRMGIVASLARPGGNITGLSNVTADLGEKGVELLKALIPTLSHAAVFVNPSNPVLAPQLKNIESAAQQLGIAILPIYAGTAEEIERGFVIMKREHVHAVIVPADPFLLQQSLQIARLAMKNRMPSIGQTREDALAGELMSYGANLPDVFRRGAVYVDKILKGAKPADLPVDQPNKFELVINLKTAKTLGLTIPQSVLTRADEVIQ